MALAEYIPHTLLENRFVLDRRFVADNVDLVTNNCRNRGSAADVARFAELDRLRRQIQADTDRLNQQAGQVSLSYSSASIEADIDPLERAISRSAPKAWI